MTKRNPPFIDSISYHVGRSIDDMTSFDLASIRNAKGWNCRELMCNQRVFAAWATQRWFYDVGWIEHTASWDWGITITMTNGDVHEHSWGSCIHGMSIGGVDFESIDVCRDYKEWHNGTGEMPAVELIISSAGLMNDDDDEAEERPGDEIVRYDVCEIAKIVLWFDT